MFSDVSDIHSNCESADLQNIQSGYFLPNDLKNGDVWDIGLKIGSNFLSNSFLCASGKNFDSQKAGFPNSSSFNSTSLLPVGATKAQQEQWLKNLSGWTSSNGKSLSTKQIKNQFIEEYMQSKNSGKTVEI